MHLYNLYHLYLIIILYHYPYTYIYIYTCEKKKHDPYLTYYDVLHIYIYDVYMKNNKLSLISSRP